MGFTENELKKNETEYKLQKPAKAKKANIGGGGGIVGCVAACVRLDNGDTELILTKFYFSGV